MPRHYMKDFKSQSLRWLRQAEYDLREAEEAVAIAKKIFNACESIVAGNRD